MTDQLYAAGLDRKDAATTLSRAPGFPPRSPMTYALAAIRHAVAAGATAGFSRLLASLHETRRQQAAVERARYRHLIYDADTGISFAADATTQAPRPGGRERADAPRHSPNAWIEAVRHPPAKARGYVDADQ